ncbi:MAG: sodium:solute symporter family protein, partial [Bacteroidota bacterium]
MIYAILIAYIAIVFLGSLGGSSENAKTPEGYFLANRGLGTLTLFFTILATNFSAFYFLGFAGAGYRIGYAHFVMMALGTGFACISFYLLGTKIWKLGKENGFITPAELIYHQTGSTTLRWIFSAVMLLFTFPYLALQIVGAGYILENLTKGDIPYIWGATFLTLFTIAYVWIGGMKSVAKTDLKQGLLMISLMLLAVVVISSSLGGLSAANEQVYQIKPDLFSREGVGEAFPPKKWFSLLTFWVFCIPMFPQIYMRFYVAKDVDKLKKSALLYGLIPLFISILPVIIGVLGHLTFPDLTGKETDQILPKMLAAHSPEWFAALVMTGALAAFMSTLDSQLLALSTIVTRDFILPFKKEMNLKRQVLIGRIWVVIFAFIGLAIAAQPFDTIDDMGRLAFGGLAVLFPITLAILRWGGTHPIFGVLSIVIGELLLIGFYYKQLPESWLLGFDSSIIVLLVCF